MSNCHVWVRHLSSGCCVSHITGPSAQLWWAPTNRAIKASWTDYLCLPTHSLAHRFPNLIQSNSIRKQQQKITIGFILQQEHFFQSNVLKVQLNCRLDMHKCIQCVPHSTDLLSLCMNVPDIVKRIAELGLMHGVWWSPEHCQLSGRSLKVDGT